jgi:hypothetical protein
MKKQAFLFAPFATQPYLPGFQGWCETLSQALMRRHHIRPPRQLCPPWLPRYWDAPGADPYWTAFIAPHQLVAGSFRLALLPLPLLRLLTMEFPMVQALLLARLLVYWSCFLLHYGANGVIDARFEVIGSPFSLLSVSLAASQNLYTRRGTVVGISGKVENVWNYSHRCTIISNISKTVSTLSLLEPFRRAVLGIPFLYQRVRSLPEDSHNSADPKIFRYLLRAHWLLSYLPSPRYPRLPSFT